MNINDIEIGIFPGRLLIELEPIHTQLINPKGLQRRKNKGKVIKSQTEGYEVGDDIYFSARRGTLLGDNALIDIKDVILHNMKLIGDRIAVEPIDEFKKTEDGKKVTDGGIIVADTIREEPQTGYVRAIGDEVKEGRFRDGDKVLFRKDAGILFADKEHVALLLSTKDIYAVL